MSAPKRPGAPRSSANAPTPPSRAPRPGATRSGSARQSQAKKPVARSQPAPRRSPATPSGGVRVSAAAKNKTRPGGPSGPGRTASYSKPRIEAAGARGSLFGAFTWRTGVLALVVVLALAVVLPSLRVYFAQQEDLRELRAERDAAAIEVTDLQGDAARWDDPAYVVAQARERLAYVFPGETPYRVTDPEAVTGVEAEQEGPETVFENPGQPWFTTLLNSIDEAATPAPDPSLAP